MSKFLEKETVFVLNKVQCIEPVSGTNYVEQLLDCYSQFKANNNDLIVLKQTIFIDIKNNKDLLAIKKDFASISSNAFPYFVATSIVPQPPLPNKLVSVEFVVVAKDFHSDIQYKQIRETPYIIIESDICKQIICGGLSSNSIDSCIFSDSLYAFECMESILSNEGMDMSHIVRQWNYIERITDFAFSENEYHQHYQIFNDVRSSFYNKCYFKDGYPAATGIGMACGGVVIDFIAVKAIKLLQISPIKSAIQIDAHRYSDHVLANNKISPSVTTIKTTPKFERAKLVGFADKGVIYVSGTAAIKGQETIHNNCVISQTQLTIENIKHLISSMNLLSNGLKTNNYSGKLTALRVYIKNNDDYKLVSEVVNSMLSNVTALYLEALVCRNDLLVEIEAISILES